MGIRGLDDDQLDALIRRVEQLIVSALHAVASAAARLLGSTPGDTSPAAVSVDDLAGIRHQWMAAVDADILPALAAVSGRAAAATASSFADAGRPVATLAAPDPAVLMAAARNRLVGVGDELWTAAREQLVEGIQAGDGIDQLTTRVRDAAAVPEVRARTIARTEVLAVNNQATLAQGLALGDPTMTKQWLATPDERTRASHRAADGQQVPIGEPFIVGGVPLMQPGDPLGPPETVINCRCAVALGFADEPVTAAATEGEEPMDNDSAEAPLTAAGTDTPTGAMVALVPSDADVARLAVDGGEPADELHCTLMYLGQAADIPPEAQQAITDTVRAYVDGWPPVEATGFALSLFNPPGVTSPDGKQRDCCVVLGMSGPDLDLVHDLVGEAVLDVQTEPAGFTVPDQHAPWTPHVTLAYLPDADMAGLAEAVAGLGDRVGPIVFDRVRVAFAGQETDIPLDAPQPGEVVDEPGDDQVAVTAAAGCDDCDFVSRMPLALRRYWIRRIAPWGKGSFARCVAQIARHYPKDPEGTCANLHKEATGHWPGEKHHSAEGTTMTTDAVTATGPGTDLADTPPAKAPTDGPGTGQPAGGDCPKGQHHDPDSGDCVDDEPPPADEPGAMPPMPAAMDGEHFASRMHVEGISTGMRTFEPGSLTWREPPFAFHWQRSSSAHGGMPETVHVGNVTRAARDGDHLYGFGVLDLDSAEGLDYARRLVAGFERWVSIGLDEQPADAEYVLPEDAGDVDEGDSLIDVLFVEPEQIVFHAGRIGELTGVSIPAQAEATIEPTAALIQALADRGVLVAAAVGSHKTSTSDASWDAAAAEKRLDSPMPVATGRKMYAWIDDSQVDGDEMPKAAGKFPHHEVPESGTPGAANLAACSAGIGALHGGRGGTSIPEADRRAVYDHLAAHIRSAGEEPPPFESLGLIVAAGYTITIPDVPPASWFDEPADVTAHGALTVTDEGRLFGYLAPAGIAHRSFPDRRVEVPMGRVDYSRWMGGEALTAGGGRVVAGPITMECGHLPPTSAADPQVRMEHYDNTCSVVAKARIGENRHGVWIAGALEPGVTADQISRMLACRLSGDWAPHPERPGWREFVAALLVPVPGFPMARSAPSVRLTDGALVAAAVPVRLAHTAPDAPNVAPVPAVDLGPALERVAVSIGRDTRSRMDALHARIHS